MRIRTHLVLMAVAVVLPVAVAASVAVATIVRQARESALERLRETARATALIVDREVQASISNLNALAASPALTAGDLPVLRQQAMILHNPGESWAFLLDAHGRQLLNTARPAPETAQPSYPLAAQRVAAVMASRKPLVTDLATGPLGVAATVIYVPVPAEGGHRYVLAQAFSPAYWNRTALGESLPGEWIVGVIDRQGRIIARSRDAERYVGQAAAAELVRAGRAAPAGLIRHRTIDGIDVYDAFTRSRASGWTVGVGAPVEAIESPAQQALAIGLAGMFLTAATTLVAVGVFGRKLTRELADARDAARDLGEFRMPSLPTSRVRELRELNRAIVDAADLLQAERESRAAADAAVQYSQRWLAAVVQTAKDAVIVANADHRIVLFNAAAETMFGHPGGQMLGRSLEELLAPGSWPPYLEEAGHLASGRTGESLGQVTRLRGRRADGALFPLECSISRVFDPSGAAFHTVILRDITDRVRDREALLKANEELQRITRAFQQALMTEVEARQAGIARELHDSVGSSLAGIALLLGSVRGSVTDAAAAGLLDKVQDQVVRTAEAVRNLSRGIMPAGTEPGALLQALEQFAHDLSELKGVRCSVQARGDFDGIDASAGTHVYRIVQEACSNAIRHGGATAIRIQLAEARGRYRLTIVDNGHGCDFEALPAAHNGMGLRSMQARASAIRGVFTLGLRGPSGGCRVRVTWPEPAAGQDRA